MTSAKSILCLAMIALTGLLAACGGGGGSGGDSGIGTTSTGINSGIAVDPYIANAQFEEVAADGQTVLQRSSSLSSATGRFSFPNEISDGSIIRIKLATRGQHANAPYGGVIKRQVFIGDQGPVVVSPLTTLLANGMAPEAVVQMLSDAGLPGLTEQSLHADPMASLADRTGTVTTTELLPLQANMAVNALLEATQDFDFAGSAAGATPVQLADLARMIGQTLDPQLYQQLRGTIGNGFTVGDLANTAADISRTVVSQIRTEIAGGNQSVSTATIDQFTGSAMSGATTIAREFYQSRAGTTTPPAPVDGQALFVDSCAGCHTAGSGTGLMDLAGDGARLTTRFGSGLRHNGITLTAEQISALATYLNAQNTSPGTGGGGTAPTGAELYAMECQGCHGSLQSSDIVTRTAAGIQAAIGANLGGMGALALTSSEIQAIASALPAVAPPPPPAQNRTGQQVYDQDCAACHALGSHDTTGSINLAGMGTTITAKIQAGHQNKTMTAAELTALATFANTFTPPPTSGGGGGPVTGACDSCHGQPPAGSSFPDLAGAHLVHTGLAGVGTDCANCHAGATHNGWIDLGFPTKWNAKSGPAADNLDGTCSNISCHGGQRTPAWGTGIINVDTQCSACHALGTAQYNSYNSGRHRLHVVDRRLSCTVCHDTAKLRNGHFTNLATTAFEQAPATTLKSSLSYVNRTCQTAGCHGSKSW